MAKRDWCVWFDDDHYKYSPKKIATFHSSPHDDAKGWAEDFAKCASWAGSLTILPYGHRPKAKVKKGVRHASTSKSQ